MWKDLTSSSHCWGCVRNAEAGNSGCRAAEYSRMSEKLERISRWVFPCFTVNQALGFAPSVLWVIGKSFKLKHNTCLSLLRGIDLWSMLILLFELACPHWHLTSHQNQVAPRRSTGYSFWCKLKQHVLHSFPDLCEYRKGYLLRVQPLRHHLGERCSVVHRDMPHYNHFCHTQMIVLCTMQLELKGMWELFSAELSSPSALFQMKAAKASKRRMSLIGES